jgi:uncharacterized ion transporter superfamily protein YfcC
MRFKFPHALGLLVGGILLAAILSYILPAGEYDRRDDPVTGRKIVVAGTFHRVPPEHVGPFQMLVSIPEGMGDAGSIIFMVFMAGGAFTVVDLTGALRSAVSWLASLFQSHAFCSRSAVHWKILGRKLSRSCLCFCC